ncbi:ComEA family DNA-binding protein [Stutzerimonas stutzeri]|uniref:ComEA family DNA-binding protein n=1 Tax=Stutzerimonas stutzeri TaxID=316 RepID=UPI0015E39777|nr:helix-hairpin-helix domain-containing protein [Stutzerimonas stutzeri]MBA1278509.1 helix-hairpin-helix domain-containing protein [Stutzerimonas stutzeri]
MTKSFLSAALSAALFALLASVSIGGHAAQTEPVAAAEVAVAQTATINLNSADAETLTRELKGIGATKAKAIIAYREAHGPFGSVDELLEVKGIGAATLEKNRAKLSLN